MSKWLQLFMISSIFYLKGLRGKGDPGFLVGTGVPGIPGVLRVLVVLGIQGVLGVQGVPGIYGIPGAL